MINLTSSKFKYAAGTALLFLALIFSTQTYAYTKMKPDTLKAIALWTVKY
jgi:hypothetical protein